MKKRLYFLLIILGCFGSTVAGDHFAGLSSNLFLQAELSPRASALGGAYTAIGNDVYAMYYNPAGVGQLKRHQIGFTHVQWFQDVRMQNASAAFKVDSRLVLGLGFSYLGMPSIQGKDIYGQPTEALTVNSSISQFSLAYKLHPSFSMGITLKYFRDNLAGFVASGFAFDVGFQMETIIPHLMLAGAVRNLGNNIQYETASEPIPFNYSVGVGYILPFLHLRLGVDAVHSLERNWLIKTGIEYDFNKMAFLRVGNDWLSSNGFQPSFGVGARFLSHLQIDYTLYNHQNLGLTHRVGVTFDFSFNKRTVRPKTSVIVLEPPKRLYAYVRDGKIHIEWSDVPGAGYNVYLRKSTDSTWKKANRHLLWAHEIEMHKPDVPVTIDVAVTSVIGQKESSFSRIVTVEVK